MNVNIQAYAPAVAWSEIEPQNKPFDRRVYYVILLVVGLIGMGALVSQPLTMAWFSATGEVLSFSTSIAFVYFPTAFILVFALGLSQYCFPLAAALFYGSLSLFQASGDTFYLAGDVQAGLTFEMVLAIPLILTGMLGGDRTESEEPTPDSLKAIYGFIILTGIGATLAAMSPLIGATAFVSRVFLPVLVTVATFHRLRSIDDYKIVWVGFLVGMALVAIFNFRRAVLGIMPTFGEHISQRYLGVTGSFAIPSFYIVGPALWMGYAMAMSKAVTRGLVLLMTAALFGMLFWLGGHRGPTFFLGILVLWWVSFQFFRYIFSIKGLIIAILAVVVMTSVARYGLTSTKLDVGLVLNRFTELWHEGIRGTARWYIWSHAMGLWAERPLLGLGPNNWVVVDQRFESVHSSFVGLLIDYGALGFIAFILFFTKILLMSRKSRIAHLPYLDQQFYRGCRAGWVCMLALLVGNLSFTSGQPKNSIFGYVVFFFPLLAMTVYSRHSPWASQWSEPAANQSGVLPGHQTHTGQPVPGLGWRS